MTTHARLIHIVTIIVSLVTFAFAFQFGIYGWVFKVFVFVPVVLSVFPLVLPTRQRMPAAIGGAAFMALYALIGTFAPGINAIVLGFIYVPQAAMMCAAVIVPWGISKGLAFAKMPVCRTLIAVVVAIPVLVLVFSAMGMPTITNYVVLACGLGILALAVCLMVGVRFSAAGIAVAGLAIMVITIFDSGLLVGLIWWIGGLFVVLGAVPYVAWGTKRETRSRRADPHPAFTERSY